MSTTRFKYRTVPEKAIRFFLFFQIGAALTILGLSFLDLFSPAVGIAFLTILVPGAILHWCYLRAQRIPLGKRWEAARASLHWQQRIRAEDLILQRTRKKREELFEAEQNEIRSRLSQLQQSHIQNGLANSFLHAAAIHGVGPTLKEQLSGHGIVSAAQVSSNLSQVPGLDEDQRQALLCWRNRIFAGLDGTKPDRLPGEQMERIRQEYRLLHEQNNTTALDAEARSILWNIRIRHGLGISRRH